MQLIIDWIKKSIEQNTSSSLEIKVQDCKDGSGLQFMKLIS